MTFSKVHRDGRGGDIGALIASGWPAERMLPEATIQTSEPLTTSQWASVNEQLEREPTLRLRIFAGVDRNALTNLQFLAFVPALRHLVVDIDTSVSLTDAPGLNRLEEGVFSMGAAGSLVVDGIQKFAPLTTLLIHAPKGAMEELSKLDSLKTVVLQRAWFRRLLELPSAEDLQLISCKGQLPVCPNLRRLYVGASGQPIEELAQRMPRLVALGLGSAKGASIEPILCLKELAILQIHDGPLLDELDRLKKLDSLRVLNVAGKRLSLADLAWVNESRLKRVVLNCASRQLAEARELLKVEVLDYGTWKEKYPEEGF